MLKLLPQLNPHYVLIYPFINITIVDIIGPIRPQINKIIVWGLPPPRPPGWGGCRRPKAPAAAPPTGVGAPQHKAGDLRDGSPPDSVGTVWAPIKIYIFVIVLRGPKPSQNAPPWGPESTPKAQKRSPRAIPNDSWVCQNSSKNIF